MPGDFSNREGASCMAFRCLVSLPNIKGSGHTRECFVTDDAAGEAQAQEFIKREDVAGRAVYECIGLVGERRRAKETAVSLAQVVIDLDLKNIEQLRDEVIQCVRALALPPSTIVDSGHGLHLKWQLKEPLIDDAGMSQAEAVMKQLVVLLAGDPAPTHRAALLRCVGSHNTKEGEPRECRVIESTGAEYDITEFADMLDIYGERPLLNYKPRFEKSNVNQQATLSSSGPVDVEARLAAMQWQGAGDSSIHLTQLHVTAALTSAGEPVTETVEKVLAATRAAAVGDPDHGKWNWGMERRELERMCFDLVTKKFREEGIDLSHTLPDELYSQWQARLKEGKRPVITRNGSGVHVRGFGGDPPATPQPLSAQAVNGNGSSPAPHLRLVDEQEKPRAALSVDEWLARELPEPVFCLSSWLTTTTRALLYAPTGIGKSVLALAMAFAISGGNSLLHWPGRRQMRVLYIDGEMAQRLLKRRIAEETKRFNSKPSDLYVLNTGDIEDFRPLDDARGRLAIDNEIARIGGADLVIFDNIMALLGGDMRDEESWRKTLDWQKSLTRRHIGQLWIHHTGHDESKGYGTKTREWQMDTVIALESVERPETDVSFQLTFKKARERTPDTRTDFVDVRVALINNRWVFETVTEASSRQPSPLGAQFLKALTNVIASDDVVIYRGERAARLDAWRRECVTLGILDPGAKPDSARSLLSKHRRELIQCRQIACHEDLTWLINRRT
jgi:AAA domain